MKISDYKSAKEDELIHEILQWVKQNNDSAYEENENLIRIQCKFFGRDITKIKKNLGLYYKKRNHVMINYDRWDTVYENLRDSYDLGAAGLLPEKTPLGYSVVLVKLLDASKEINFVDLQLRALFVAETVQRDDLLGKKVIVVIDYTGVQLSFLFRMNIFALQKAYKTWREYAFVSLSEIHHINLPTHSYYIINIVNYILDDKLKKVNYFHSTDLTEFYQHVPQEILPEEYGGNAKDLTELSEFWYTETMTHCGPVVEYFKSRAENAAKSKKTSKPFFYEIPFKLFGKIRRRGNVA